MRWSHGWNLKWVLNGNVWGLDWLTGLCVCFEPHWNVRVSFDSRQFIEKMVTQFCHRGAQARVNSRDSHFLNNKIYFHWVMPICMVRFSAFFHIIFAHFFSRNFPLFFSFQSKRSANITKKNKIKLGMCHHRNNWTSTSIVAKRNGSIARNSEEQKKYIAGREIQLSIAFRICTSWEKKVHRIFKLPSRRLFRSQSRSLQPNRVSMVVYSSNAAFFFSPTIHVKNDGWWNATPCTICLAVLSAR